MRKTVVLVLAFAACMVSAAPALAKGEGDMPTESSGSVSGPGLPGPIHMSFKGDCGVVYPCQNFLDFDNPLVNLASLTGLSGLRAGSSRSYIGAPPPAAQLGPRYRFTVTASTDKQSETVVQDIYPFAGERGWIFTPPGQSIFTRPLQEGWLPAPFSLRDALIDLGVPARPPVVAPVSAPVASPERSPSPLLLGAALLAALAIGGVLMAVRMNRRDLPRPA
ncbi:MAG TPA: hypothetical protein VKA30_01740 [Actinomycetota bacterium]|nr:hypothetical protein [Actinomycetota bacterium]